ncbi:hypothetical protein, variant [Aphanomyces invadans]|uniref:MSP domain-containing protein n=1 Tax=Aphanomyces invadans TaxID=157072 RepID=A0A024U8E6_9STRA|nr:hypothetical protein, variant [Aphanomyces invadans]ETW02711.1 hypothetical protein, variant [Aphanomyces invadans]|eukprot:XP_008869316.1 hypothetical protein, variant [Aphanomyces invadans]
MDGAGMNRSGSPRRLNSSSNGHGFKANAGNSFKRMDDEALQGWNAIGSIGFDMDAKYSRMPSPSVSSKRFSFAKSPSSPLFVHGTYHNEEVKPKKRDSLEDLFLPTQSLVTQAESISLAPVLVDLDKEEFVDAATFITRSETSVRASTKPLSPARKNSFDVNVIESPQDFFARRSRNLKSVEFGAGDDETSAHIDISLELNKAISSSIAPPSTTEQTSTPKIESSSNRGNFYKSDHRGLTSPRESTTKRSEMFAKDVVDSQRGRSTGSFPSFQADHGMRTGSGNLPVQEPKPFSKLNLSISQDISGSLAPSVGFATSEQQKRRNPNGLTVETLSLVDRSNHTPLPSTIRVNFNHDSAQAVADAIQMASAMPSSDRANMNWTNPIHPSEVIHHSLDAVVAVQAMMEATNAMQNSVTEVLRLRALAQKAVEAAVVSEAMAIADYHRGEGAIGEVNALTQSATENSVQNHGFFQRLPSGQQCPSPMNGSARHEFSTGRSQAVGQHHGRAQASSAPLPSANRIPNGADAPLRAQPATAPSHAESVNNSATDRKARDTHGVNEDRSLEERLDFTDFNREVSSWQHSIATNAPSQTQSPRRNQRQLGNSPKATIKAPDRNGYSQAKDQALQHNRDIGGTTTTGHANNSDLSPEGEFGRQTRHRTPTNELPPTNATRQQRATILQGSAPSESTRAVHQQHRDEFTSTEAMHAEELVYPSTETPTSLRSQRLVAQELPTTRSNRADMFQREDHYYAQSSPRTLDRPKLCKRFLCTIGGEISETFVFRNTSSKFARICASIVPLSRGCNQFVIAPTVLEMAPNSSDHFVIRFVAARIGAVSAIFQFRSMSGDPLATPYEIIVDAHVKKASATPLDLPSRPTLAEDLHNYHPSPHVFDVQPTHLKLTSGAAATFDIFNYVATTTTFTVNCPFDHIQVIPNAGEIHPNGKCTIQVSLADSSHTKAWCGLIAVIVNGSLPREISLVVDASMSCVDTASSIKEMAMSYSTESTSTTARTRSRKRGLFFQATRLDFGPRTLRSSHCLPVRICNGSKESITVFLQPVSAPFSCSYSSISLRPRSYVEVPVYFTPAVPRDVTASMVAFSAADKATLTLQGRGVA